MPLRRILYLALADARGHLMRAHLLSRLLADDFQVSVVTTGVDGEHFLERLGTAATVLSEHFRVEFNSRHDMSRSRTDRRVLNYLVLPWRGWADLKRLSALARGATLVVNDSLHPALLAAPAVGFLVPVVQVYGENLWRALEENFQGRAPAWQPRLPAAVAEREGRGLRPHRPRRWHFPGLSLVGSQLPAASHRRAA